MRVMVVLNGSCLWQLAGTSTGAAPLGWLDLAGFLLFWLGLTVEVAADYEKYTFNKAHKPGQNARWIDHGLWSVSRHPNYCGEITVWAGLAVISAAGGGARSAAVAAISPMWSCFFLVFTSLMLLEKRSDAKWGHLEAYRAYRARTPVLFPFWR